MSSVLGLPTPRPSALVRTPAGSPAASTLSALEGGHRVWAAIVLPSVTEVQHWLDRMRRAVCTTVPKDVPVVIAFRADGEFVILHGDASVPGFDAATWSCPRPTGNLFRRDGDYWTIAYVGQVVRLRHANGLTYLAHLLARPGCAVSCMELTGALGVRGGGDRGPDFVTVRSYHGRVRELRRELSVAESHHDLARTERLRRDLDAIEREVLRVVRQRGVTNQVERARTAVAKAIASAVGRVGKALPALADHLAVTIKRGYECRYHPDPRLEVRWTV